MRVFSFRSRSARRLISAAVAAFVCAPGWAASPSTPPPLSSTVHPELWPSVSRALPPDPGMEARIKSLLASMSVEDKVGQLIQADISAIKPEDLKTYRLGSVLAGGNSGPNGDEFSTPEQWRALVDQFHQAALAPSPGHASIPLLFGVDAVHGHNNVVGATLFPQNSALGSMRDPDLIREIGAATAAEVRATDIDWTFAPTLAVPQDDRWGRTYEGYSQDPKVVAAYATAMVEGLQGMPGTPAFLGRQHVVSTAKHFLGDGGTFQGRDQGDARVSEKVLRDVHGAGYVAAIAAGAQTVMASFSSWNGVKMHGNHALLTDVLKGRMGFDGFVVGDWQAHGQLEGCSNESCAKAINAGLDMFMAPDTWRALYKNTLAQVKSGEIPQARLNDAVSRILRVKLRADLFEKNTQKVGSGDLSVIGSAAHRDIARRAVRESLVLLKNQRGVLPIDPHKHVLVAGDGADNLSKQSGGWTITWQGSGVPASKFPGATSIYAGIAAQVKAAGGTATLSPDGSFSTKPDVAVVVFGEDPYAEFQGDLKNFAYKPGSDDADLKLLRKLKGQGVPVVAVFLAGRPLWVNREINASDAFVMAWLPGSEGEGIADVLLRNADGAVQYDFHGKLSFAWPRTAMQVAQAAGQKSQYPFGFGLTYADHDHARPLSEVSGLSGKQDPNGIYVQRGRPVQELTWTLADAGGKPVAVSAAPASSPRGQVTLAAVDYKTQEDAREITWSGKGGELSLHSSKPLELQRETNGDVMLSLTLRADEIPASGKISLGVDCEAACRVRLPIRDALAQLPKGQWTTLAIPLKCFQQGGAAMQSLASPFVLESDAPMRLSLWQVGLDSHADTVLPCPSP
ncbi:MAG: exo 1,3/1,4-beta-D-glucan glucohydrolase [Pseudomonadota bacterium]|nr:exo 1,3/1,4-beta-D-glucan glucohydrolase [Pseudomonadota bacterium]